MAAPVVVRYNALIDRYNALIGELRDVVRHLRRGRIGRARALLEAALEGVLDSGSDASGSASESDAMTAESAAALSQPPGGPVAFVGRSFRLEDDDA